jgi:hypothetical protein
MIPLSIRTQPILPHGFTSETLSQAFFVSFEYANQSYALYKPADQSFSAKYKTRALAHCSRHC